MLGNLEKKRDYLNEIFHHLQDGIIIMNEKRDILLMNPSAEKLTGWQVGENVPFCTFCQTRKLSGDENRCYLVSRQEVPFFLSQMPVYKGRTLDVEMSTAVMFEDEHTHEQEILLVLRDQTLKRKEEEARLSKMMIKKLIEAKETEHHRLAQELHDGVGQSLYSVSVALQAIEPHIGNERLQEYFSEAKYELDKVINDVKRYSQRLRPRSLDQLGLVATIEEMIGFFEQSFPNVNIVLQTNVYGRLQAVQEINLYRIVQEALQNVMKYADATRVFIELILENNHITLQIIDDGKGFDSTKIRDGLGLKHMEERANQMAGHFSIRSEIGEGTEVFVTIPYEKDEVNAESDVSR